LKPIRAKVAGFVTPMAKDIRFWSLMAKIEFRQYFKGQKWTSSLFFFGYNSINIDNISLSYPEL